MGIDPGGDVVLLIVEEAVEADTWERRDRRYQAFIPVPDVPTADEVAGLRTAMGWGADELDSEMSRYHRVCIVAFAASPVRIWVAAFFAAEMPWLIDASGLSCCVPPFDPRHTTAVTTEDATALIGDWERLRPAPPPPPSTTPGRQPGSGRPGSGGFWSGPSLAVRAADPDVFHLRVGEGRRSFCGLRAKDLGAPDPYVRYDDVPDDRRYLECAVAWLEELRPRREDERRRVSFRLEAVAGLLRAFDHLDAVNRTVADAADRPQAHAALTAAPFGYTDLQAFHILNLSVGHQTAEGRADLETQQAGLLSWLARLDAFLAPGFDGRKT